jgi:hypothetical protein
MDIWLAILSAVIGVVGVALTIVGVRLGTVQSGILNELAESNRRLGKLQDATAELEMREKIGCIRGNAGRLRASVELRSTAKTKKDREELDAAIQRDRELVVQDSRAVLPVFDLAPESLQIEYKDAVLYAIEVLSRTNQIEHLGRLRTAIAERAHRITTVASAARLHSLVEQSKALAPGHRGSAEIPQRLFSYAFQPAVRVIFDWSRMEHEKWPVRLEVFDRLDEISSWYLPWNVNRDGKEVRFDDVEAHPIQLSALPTRLTAFSDERQQKVNSLVEALAAGRNDKHPTQLVAAAYALPGGHRLVLDGTHRLSALMMARIPFTLLVFTVYGPLEGRIVPELRHWERVRTPSPEPRSSLPA